MVLLEPRLEDHARREKIDDQYACRSLPLAIEPLTLHHPDDAAANDRTHDCCCGGYSCVGGR